MQLSLEEFRYSGTLQIKSNHPQQHGLHHPSHPGSALETLVLELVSTPARGNENSWEDVESRTARQSETDEEEGRVLQG